LRAVDLGTAAFWSTIHPHLKVRPFKSASVNTNIVPDVIEVHGYWRLFKVAIYEKRMFENHRKEILCVTISPSSISEYNGRLNDVGLGETIEMDHPTPNLSTDRWLNRHAGKDRVCSDPHQWFKSDQQGDNVA
jgi:hypothetical protein